VPCEGDADCRSGEVCIDIEVCPDCFDDEPACLAPCTLQGECLLAPVDVVSCIADDECAAGQICSVSLGDCPVRKEALRQEGFFCRRLSVALSSLGDAAAVVEDGHERP
jgi:hypothetical protein